MKDMEKAVDKIISVLKEMTSQEHDEMRSIITIYGDYDVDGTTGTALLETFFREIGVTVKYYIPERQVEGYGMNMNASDCTSVHMCVCVCDCICSCGVSAQFVSICTL